MASTDAKAIPVKNAALRITFPILDADGDLVTGATSLDSEVSKDGGTFADCTNEATEIATSSGMYYLDLTSTEMNADTVAVIVKSGNGKTTPIVLYTASQNINDIPTAAAIADAVWDEAQSGHTTGGSFGEIATEIADILVDTGTTLQGELDGIQADTEDIQTRLPAALVGGRIDATIDATGLESGALALINAEVDTAIADVGLTTTITGRIDAAITTRASATALQTVDDEIAVIDGNVDSILVDTAEIGAAGAGLTALASASNLATVAGYIDTEIGTILTNLATVDTVVDAIKLVTDKLSGLVLTNGTIGSTGNSTTALHLDGLTYGDDEINGQFLAILDVSTNEIHVREITNWDLASEVATVATLPFTPENAVDTYWILSLSAGGSAPSASAIADEVQTRTIAAVTLVNGLAANTVTAAALATDAVTEIQSGLATASALSTVAGYLDTEVAAIKAVTDALPDAGALTSLATAAALTTVDSVVDAIKVTTDKVDDTLEDDAGTYRFTTNALEQAPTGGSAPTVGQIADEVQTRTIAAVTVVNGLAANTVTAVALATDAGQEIADRLLQRNIMGGSDSGRTVSEAFAVLRNRVQIDESTVTVYRTDDTTAYWTASIATVDPANGLIQDLNPS